MITKVCDFIDLFADVNGKLIEKAKKKNGGKGGITNIFADVTHSLSEVERLMKEIRVISIKTYLV